LIRAEGAVARTASARAGVEAALPLEGPDAGRRAEQALASLRGVVAPLAAIRSSFDGR
jgi:hypothetical protein